MLKISENNFVLVKALTCYLAPNTSTELEAVGVTKEIGDVMATQK